MTGSEAISLTRVGEETEAVRSASWRGTETVLLVEDDPAVRSLTRRILGYYGYRVIESAGAADALDLAQTHPGNIHLLLTGAVMPEMSGSNLAAIVHKTRPFTKVIYMSDNTGEAAARLGLIERGTTVVQKPFTPSALATTIREILDS